MKKVLYFCLFVTAFVSLLCQVSCSDHITEVMDDCGYSMSYKKVADGQQAEIVFSEVTAEVLSGHKNCGFGYIPRQVENASVKGIKLEERQRGDRFAYIAPPFFDGKKDVVNLQVQGRGYISTPESYKEVGGTVFISVGLFPPK